MHACNTSPQETEAGMDQEVPGQPELLTESPSQEVKQPTKKKKNSWEQ